MSRSSHSFEDLHRGGLFLFPSNSIYINHSQNAIVEALRQTSEDTRQLCAQDTRALSFKLTYNHELNHFVHFISSPYLVLFDDISDQYMSSMGYALNHAIPQLRGGILPMPLVNLRSSGMLNAKALDRLARSELCRETQNMMIFQNPTVGDLVDGLNKCIASNAISRGKHGSTCAIQSRLPRHRKISENGWTVLNILEALARARELAIIDEYKLSDRVVEYWLMHKLFPAELKDYSTVYMSLNPIFGASTMVVMLLCSLRGGLFPYLPKRSFFSGNRFDDIYLEDFHPVILLERFVKETPSLLGRESESTCKQLYRTLAHKHQLVGGGDQFAENRQHLDSNFQNAFPEIQSSLQYQSFAGELKRIGELRSKYLAAESSNIVRAIHDSVISSDRFFATDGVFSTNDVVLEDLYSKAQGPFLAHDRRLAMTALWEWLVFGQKKLLEEWRMVFHSIQTAYQVSYSCHDYEAATIRKNTQLCAIPTF